MATVIITNLRFYDYNKYDSSLCSWAFHYEPGNGNTITASNIPVNSTIQQVIEKYILVEYGWASAEYMGVTYPVSPISYPIVLVTLAIGGGYLFYRLVLKKKGR